MRRLHELRGDDKGATAVEYALILALVFLSMIVGVQTFASGTIAMWNNVTDAVEAQ